MSVISLAETGSPFVWGQFSIAAHGSISTPASWHVHVWHFQQDACSVTRLYISFFCICIHVTCSWVIVRELQQTEQRLHIICLVWGISLCPLEAYTGLTRVECLSCLECLVGIVAHGLNIFTINMLLHFIFDIMTFASRKSMTTAGTRFLIVSLVTKRYKTTLSNVVSS